MGESSAVLSVTQKVHHPFLMVLDKSTLCVHTVYTRCTLKVLFGALFSGFRKRIFTSRCTFFTFFTFFGTTFLLLKVFGAHFSKKSVWKNRF